jgi:hypothetical protein
MRMFLIVGAVAATLAGCQTPQESLASAQDVCIGSGFRPGTRAYSNCVNGNYQQNRRESAATSNAVATGVVAGVVGGAIIGAAARPAYYGRPYGYYGRPYGYYGSPGYYY